MDVGVPVAVCVTVRVRLRDLLGDSLAVRVRPAVTVCVGDAGGEGTVRECVGDADGDGALTVCVSDGDTVTVALFRETLRRRPPVMSA